MHLVLLVLHADVITLDDSLNLLRSLRVLLFELISVCSEQVNIVVERLVLLLGLDERSDDFLRGRDASRLLDLFEGVLKDLHVPQVLRHQSVLFLVSGDDLRQAQLENLNAVAGRPSRLLRLGVDVLGGAFLLALGLVLSVENLVHFLDLSLEVELVLLEFGLERNRMVHVLLCESLVLLILGVLLLALALDVISLALQLGALCLHIGQLLTHDIDLLAKVVVLCASLVQS